MSEKFNQLKQLISDCESDVEKFYVKNVNASGSRLRKSLQEIKKLSQEIRIEIQEKKNIAKKN